LEEFTVQWARICHQFCLIFGSHIPTEHFNAISSPLEKQKEEKGISKMQLSLPEAI
jgi:hypothetical protein